MKKSRDSITIYHDDNPNDHYGGGSSHTTVAASSSISNSSGETFIVKDDQPPLNHNGNNNISNNNISNNNSDNNSVPIKLTTTRAIQLTPSTTTTSDKNNAKPANATTNAILSLKQNPFYHEKRRWDDSFTLAEKKELTGNIVKAARDMEGGNLITLQEEEYTVPNLSNDEEDNSQESDDVDSNRKPGRKPMADEEALSDSDQDPKVKRKAQNRAAQRAFRERKERYVKELEAKLKQVQDNHLVATSQLVRENHQLRSIIYRLEAENYALKGIPMQPYQHQTVLSPQPPIPQQQQQQQRSSNNSNGNFPTIAPLLPNTQQPLLLPSYLSNSPPATSILNPANSPSVNHMMMLAQTPLQQYPMSPVVSMNHGSSLNSSPSPTLSNTNNNHKIAMPKKVSSKKSNSHHHTPTPPPNNQPLEYTFSISTPASLRPSGGAVSSSSKHTRSEPVELVQLYPPSGSRNQHNSNNSNNNNNTATNDSSSSATLQKSDLIRLSSPNNTNNAKKAPSVASVASIGSPGSTTGVNNTTAVATPNSTGSGLHYQFADDNSSTMSDKTSSTVNTQQQRKKMQQLTSDMFDCHIDTEGQIFCERLHNEVCNDAFDRLLSEPLFDQMGKLNLSIGNCPVPIVTGHMSLSTLEEQPESTDSSNDTSATTSEEDTPATNQQEKEEGNKEKNKSNPTSTTTASDSPMSPANNTTATTSTSSEKRLLTCPEIWFLLNQHEKFNNFTTDQYCQAVKELAKCSDSGPVLEEADLYQIMTKMDQGYL